MRSRGSAGVALAIATCVAIGPAARADSAHRDEPPATRISAALSGGRAFGFDASADGRPLAERDDDVGNGLLSLGVDHSVVRWLALGVEARVGSWDSNWSTVAGYDQPHMRILFDVDAVLRIRSPTLGPFRWPVVLSVSPSGGFTAPAAPARDTRAVRETWHPRGGGGNFGIDVTAETWYKLRRSRWQLGGVVGVGYSRHWFSLDGTFTPVSDPGAAVSARYDYVTDMVLFKLGILAGF